MKTSGGESKNFEARIAVGHSPEPQSAIFRIWSQKGKSNVYASLRNIAGQIKISLHESGMCNAGLTSQFAENETNAVAAIGGSRHQSTWYRKTHVGSRVVTPLQFAIPASQLKVWNNNPGTNKKILWIAPPESDHSIIISCIYSGQAVSDDNWPGRSNGTQLVGTKVLSNGEKFWLVWQKCPTGRLEIEILSEAEKHMRQQKLVTFSNLTPDTPPPVRRLIFKEYPNDHCLIVLDAVFQ
jgi:hypothetical protein